VRIKTPIQADRILEAASRLFGGQRFHEVRMEDIAAEAQVGKGTLYRYFKDKEELYIALLARASNHFIERMHQAVHGDKPPRRRLINTVHEIIKEFDDQPQLLDLIQRAEVMHMTGTAFPWQSAREELPKLLKVLFDEGAKTGAWQINDPDLTVLMFMGAIRAVIRFGNKPRPSDLAERIVDYFLLGASKSGSNEPFLGPRTKRRVPAPVEN
jgi:TetR/AcrR family fatty acid metabolism transcriptional regulator